jgi:peptide/nickel transport system substrate-binding protein
VGSMEKLTRRLLLGALAAGAPGAGGAAAQGMGLGDDAALFGSARRTGDGVTIAWPSDVPGWDPNRRFMPDAQSLYRMVFDPALDQEPRLGLAPHLVRSWELAEDAMSLALELRDDVTFHDGTALTSEDIAWTFLERPRAEPGVDLFHAWGRLAAVETPSPTRAVMRFEAPFATAPLWLAFLGGFVVPARTMQRMGSAAFARNPVGSGPYRLVEHEPGARIVLERNARWWGPRPVMRRVTVEIIRDPSLRAAAVESGRAQLAVGMKVREVWRMAENTALVAELNPISRMVMVLLRNDGPFGARDLRLAAHHGLDKAALCQAFYPSAAQPLSVPAVPGTAAFVDGFTVPFDAVLARQFAERAGYGPGRPARVRLATTRGHFPGDYDLARAIAFMWRRVGIEAAIEVIDPARHFELNRAGLLPDATLYAFDNATGDPELCAGVLLNPDTPFSPWKDPALGAHAARLAGEADPVARLTGWRELTRQAVELGALLPVMQAVQTVVRRKELAWRPYGNGWVLPQTMDWVSL